MDTLRMIRLLLFSLLMFGIMVLPVVVQKVSADSDLYVYPKGGQSSEQQEKDEHACYKWAKGQSGFDPMRAPTATSAPPPKEAKKGGAGRGALGGAAAGAIIGGVTGGSAGKGAVIGAGAGALIGGVRRSEQTKKQEQAEQQWAADQSAQYAHNRNSYNRAYSVCLEGRDYTVK